MSKWITFDLDGTLMQNPFSSRVFPEIKRQILMQNSNLTDCIRDIVLEHRKRLNDAEYVEAYDWDQIIEQYLHLNNLDEAINVEDLVKKNCKPPAIYLLEDTILSVLKELRLKGFKLAVVTNGFSKYQLPVMDALGLTPYFDQIITPDEVGFAKPDKRVFEQLYLVGDIVAAHVGDRIDHDVIVANEAGVHSVFISRNLSESMKKSGAGERVLHPEAKGFLLAKYQDELKNDQVVLPNKATPNKIICSIEELLKEL